MLKEDKTRIEIAAVDVPPQTISRTIQSARGKISQNMLGSLSGIDQSTISRIEAGIVEDPSYSTVYNTLYACGYRLVAIPARAEYRI